MSLITKRRHDGNELTLADLDAMPDDGHRYELVGGVIVVSPAPNWNHQRAVRRLMRMVEDACPPGHEVFDSPCDLALPLDQIVQPDVLLVPIQRGEEFGPIADPPVLLIEILSPGNRGYDLRWKRDVYAEAGVPHYWIVDPANTEAIILELDAEAGAYVERARGAVVETQAPVAVTIDVAELVAPPR